VSLTTLPKPVDLDDLEPLELGRPSLGLRLRAGVVRRFNSPFRVVTVAVAIGFMLLVLYPLYKILLSLFYKSGHVDTTAFSDFANTDGVRSAILNTVFVVVVSGVISIIIGGTMAWLNERTNARMGPVTDFLPMIPFLFPTIASAIGWVFLLSDRSGFVNAILRSLLNHVGIHLTSGPLNIYSIWGLIFVYIIHNTPFAFLMISTGLRNMDTQLEEQSWMSGASPRRTLLRVVLPAMTPSVLGALLLVTWSGFGLYSIPAAIAQPAHVNIMTVSIVKYINFDYPANYGAAVVMSLIILSFIGSLWYVSRRIVGQARFSRVGGRGSRAPRRSLGVWKWPVRIVFIGYAALGTLLPAAALMLVALNGYWTTRIKWHHLSFRAFNGYVFHSNQTALAFKNSAMLAIVVATVGILVAAMISYVTRIRTRATSTLDGMIKMPVIISHLVIALGFILAFAGPPFRLGGTTMILVLAYLGMFMPQATIVTDPAAAQVGAELHEASSLSGARSFRTFRTVYLPLMIGALAIGWSLLFVRILGDLEVSALLAGPNSPTIGSVTLATYTNGNFAGVAALTLTLTAVTTGVLVIVFTFANRLSKWSSARTINPITSVRPD
jgi:iron(III) transport system permease protein